jgi:hypothetical protein
LTVDHDPRTRRRRELIVTAALAVLLGGGIFFFALLLFGQFLFAILAVVAVMALAGLFHYLTWGRAEERRTASPPPGEEPGRGPGWRF